MSQTQSQSGSLTIEECEWNYESFAARARCSVVTLKRYVSLGLLRRDVEYYKRPGKWCVWFHPQNAMTRLAWIWENPDVLREAKKKVASRLEDKRRATGDEVVRDRARG